MAVYHPGLAMEIGDLLRLVRDQTLATIQNASIGSAGIRVYDGGRIVIENGGLDILGEALIEGLLRVTGRLEGTGVIDWDGNATFNGDVSVTKDLDVTALTRLRGKTTLEDDLTVTSGGTIIVGDMTIEPVSGGGRVRFANGATVTADGAGASLALGSSRVFVDSQHAQMSHGGTLLSVANGSITAAGMGTFSEPTLPAGVLRTNLLGRLERNVP